MLSTLVLSNENRNLSIEMGSPHLYRWRRMSLDCMAKIGYQIKQTMDEELPNGKKFIRLDFIR